MPNSCAVLSCKSNYRSTRKHSSNVPTFTFPRNPVINDAWIKTIKRNNWKPKKHSTICIKHFQENDFVNFSRSGRKKLILKKDAIPSVFFDKLQLEEIYIQKRDFQMRSVIFHEDLQNKNYEDYIENTEYMPDYNKLEKTTKKCGEIFTNGYDSFNFLCTICGILLKDMNDFMSHIKVDHKNTFQNTLEHPEAVLEESEIKIESDPFGSVLENIEVTVGAFSLESYNQEDNIDDQNAVKMDSVDQSKDSMNKTVLDPTNNKFLIHDLTVQPETHNKNEEHNKDEIKETAIEKNPFKCRYCDRHFKQRSVKLEHEYVHTGEKPYKCNNCGKSFRRKSRYAQHLKIHENKKEYKCEICGFAFNCKPYLTVHMRQHKNDKRYKCSYCDKTFVGCTGKIMHERTHTGEKPNKCTECNDRFITRGKLNVHIRKMHTGERPFKCDYCDKTFFDGELKRKHLRVHTKEKPYTCNICNATFPFSGDLRKHERIHSNEIGYVCDICGKGFKQFSALHCHKKTHDKNMVVLDRVKNKEDNLMR